MMKAYLWISISVAACCANPAFAEKRPDAEARATAASPEAVALASEVTDDPLDTVVKVSTEPFYTLKQGLFKSASSDKFVRAFINKKSGSTIFQVYVWVVYSGPYAMYDQANYETNDGPKTAVFTHIDQQVLGCSRYGCSQREDFAFQVPESDLRAACRDAAAGTGATWKFRLMSKVGAETTEMLRTEIAGALLAVDAQRAKLGFKSGG